MDGKETVSISNKELRSRTGVFSVVLHEEKLSRVEGAPAYPSRLSKCPLFFFMFGFAILKDFLYLFVAKFTGRKLYR